MFYVVECSRKSNLYTGTIIYGHKKGNQIQDLVPNEITDTFLIEYSLINDSL